MTKVRTVSDSFDRYQDALSGDKPYLRDWFHIPGKRQASTETGRGLLGLTKPKTNRKLNLGRALGDLRHEIGALEYRFRNGERNLWPKLVELWRKERELSVSYGILAGAR